MVPSCWTKCIKVWINFSIHSSVNVDEVFVLVLVLVLVLVIVVDDQFV